MSEMEEILRPPALDPTLEGNPLLGDITENPVDSAESPPSPGQWTPEVVKTIMQGIFAMVEAWRGPVWQYPEDEADPLLPSTATVMNNTPGLKNMAPEHVALAVVVTGWGTIAAKRVGWERQLAAMAKQQETAEASPDLSAKGGSPYGENRLQR